MGTGLTSSIIAPLRHLVYVRTAKATTVLPLNGQQDGWVLEPRLRCQQVRWLIGPRVGDALLDFVPVADGDAPFEAGLQAFGIDDQVRVVALPVVDELVQQPDPDQPDAGRVLFEGVLIRRDFAFKANAEGAGEMVTLLAQPLAWLDNMLSQHIIAGRWVALPDDARLVVESPALPAIFNQGGKPNRHASATITAASTIALRAPLFTHDDDPQAAYWTVREAIASTLAMWLYGPSDAPLSRHIDLEDETFSNLADDVVYAGRWLGLDAPLPETNVHGLGVLDALEAICRRSGFQFACQMVEPQDGYYDRRQVLKLWRKHTGTLVYFDLGKRGATYSDAEAFLAANNINNAGGMYDGTEIANEAFVRGREFIEARFELKPLWNPADAYDGELTAAQQVDATPELLASDPYFSVHVPGGAEYLPQLGRSWGLDCIGGFVGYASGDYQHDEDGFDFVGELGLAGSPIEAVRRTFNAAPIAWTRRVRHALPLRSPAARAADESFFLEVSEDAGVTWFPAPVRFHTLTDNFGIQLEVHNLCRVSLATLGTPTPPAPEASWFALLEEQQLRFRLTCVIECDHSFRWDALRRSSSLSQYRRGIVAVTEHERTWVQPETIYNDGSAWIALPAQSNGAISAVSLSQIAEAQRDAGEAVRLSVAAQSPRLDQLDRYQLGDRIGGIRGRDVSFRVDGGSTLDARCPEIVGLTVVLSPAEAQRLRFTLADNRTDGGGNG